MPKRAIIRGNDKSYSLLEECQIAHLMAGLAFNQLSDYMAYLVDWWN